MALFATLFARRGTFAVFNNVPRSLTVNAIFTLRTVSVCKSTCPTFVAANSVLFWCERHISGRSMEMKKNGIGLGKEINNADRLAVGGECEVRMKLMYMNDMIHVTAQGSLQAPFSANTGKYLELPPEWNFSCLNLPSFPDGILHTDRDGRC